MSPFRRLLTFLRAHRTRFAFAAGCSLVTTASLLAFPVLVKEMFADGAISPTSVLSRIALLALLLIVSSYAAYASMFTISRRVCIDVQVAYCDRLLRLPMSFHRSRSTGDLIDRFSRAIPDIDWFLRYTLMTLIILVLLFVGGLGMLFVLSWKLTLLLTVGTLFSVGLIRRLLRTERSSVTRKAQANGALSARLQEFLAGIEIIKSFRTESRERRAFSSLAASAHVGSRVYSFVEPLILTLAITLLLLLLLAGRYLIGLGELDVPSLLAYLMVALLLVPQARAVSLALVRWEQFSAAIRRLDEILSLEIEPGAGTEHGIAPSLHGVIEFRNVSAAYQEGRNVLDGLTFRIGERETIGIVGTSGAGKTTLFSLLLRFTDYRGSILLDGNELSSYPLAESRSAFAVVPQDAYLFQTSILENIRYGRPDARLEEVEDVSRIAQADAFIKQLPGGYETIVGERGATLSGGQRQRIAIARALLSNAPVLLLDEPTSSLDAQTEADLQRALGGMMNSRSVIIIAHRLATVIHLPRIIVLHEGRLVDEGTHEQLLARSTHYRHLVASQFVSAPAMAVGNEQLM